VLVRDRAPIAADQLRNVGKASACAASVSLAGYM
jgi:hypothetical protein